jgi:hypothetical protein
MDAVCERDVGVWLWHVTWREGVPHPSSLPVAISPADRMAAAAAVCIEWKI